MKTVLEKAALEWYKQAMIHQQIKDELKKAMIAKDEVRLGVIRGLLSGFTNELVVLKKMPSDMLEDADAQRIIMRQAKQRKDSIEQFVAGGRPELADGEKAELAILETFLPTQMSEEEIRTFVSAKKAATGTVDKSQAGMFTGSIMKELKGKADGALVKKVVDEMLG